MYVEFRRYFYFQLFNFLNSVQINFLHSVPSSKSFHRPRAKWRHQSALCKYLIRWFSWFLKRESHKFRRSNLIGKLCKKYQKFLTSFGRFEIIDLTWRKKSRAWVRIPSKNILYVISVFFFKFFYSSTNFTANCKRKYENCKFLLKHRE
jgi:hypothetical protein